MQENKITILSTRPLQDSLIDEVETAGIAIDILSFIETEPIQTIEVQQEIEQAFLQSTAVVFTSMNAVDAVITYLDGQPPDWKIYCIGNTTRQLVKRYFGEDSIAGTANSAAALANLVLEEEDAKEIIFFCGDQRRDELPGILRDRDIDVNEIVVYQTITVPRKVDKTYHGILFFSPSAVTSFFLNNKPGDQTILFAIGNTTATEIRKYSKNRIISSEEPGKEELVRLAIEFFTGA